MRGVCARRRRRFSPRSISRILPPCSKEMVVRFIHVFPIMRERTMAISQQDIRLLDGLKHAKETIGSFEFEGAPARWAGEAVALLGRTYDTFVQQIDAKDRKEVKSDETQAKVRRARVTLNRSFEQLWNGLQIK